MKTLSVKSRSRLEQPFLPGAGTALIWPVPESAPGRQTSRADQKSGGSVTLVKSVCSHHCQINFFLQGIQNFTSYRYSVYENRTITFTDSSMHNKFLHEWIYWYPYSFNNAFLIKVNKE